MIFKPTIIAEPEIESREVLVVRGSLLIAVMIHEYSSKYS